MSTPNANKKSSSYKVLIQVAMKLHNPQVIEAYQLNLEEEQDQIQPIYSKYLRIYPEDSVWEILIKFCLFYLVDGRLWVQSSIPMWWAQKKENFKPQLAIQYRPVGTRKKFSFRSYANNPTLHIPHYNGENRPYLPSYTIGRYRVTYILKDQTSIVINASTLEEAEKVVIQHANYTKLDKRPEGSVEDNLTRTRSNKTPRMNGVKIEPFKGEYFTGGEYGINTLVRIQL
ncbi:hypothetical protein [Chamaesiphon sp. OTE_75_metabat_556]|uniref:hypothetical protein n=1 Tax=Chamaesiphon sp. OTE_75_metabat_556 TaxID=2964692 RepID=UPI00286AC4E4|nr:hypothetical protein [Chamaesiphon sp. OTE_75_metabat_556]